MFWKGYIIITIVFSLIVYAQYDHEKVHTIGVDIHLLKISCAMFIVACIIISILICYMIKKKFDKLEEIKNPKLEITLVIILNIIIFVMGLSYAVMIYNQ